MSEIDKKCYFCEQEIETKICPICKQDQNGIRNQLILIGGILLLYLIIFIVNIAASSPNISQKKNNNDYIDEVDSLFSSTSELNDPVTKNPEETEGLFSKVMSWLGGSADSNIDLKYSALEAMGYSKKDVDQLIKNEEETYKQLGYSKKEIAEIRKLENESYEQMGLTEDNMNELYGSLGLDTVGTGDLEEAAIALMASFFAEEDDIVAEAPKESNYTDSLEMEFYKYFDIEDPEILSPEDLEYITKLYNQLNFTSQDVKRIKLMNSQEINTEIGRQINYLDTFDHSLQDLMKMKWTDYLKYIDENMTIEDVKEDIAKMSDKQKDYYKEQYESFVESITENYNLNPSEQERLESFTNSFFNYID